MNQSHSDLTLGNLQVMFLALHISSLVQKKINHKHTVKRSVNNMRILNFSFSVFIFIFIFLDDTVIHALDINCPHSRCGSNPYSIQYPFILKGQQPQVCSHYINLTCISQTNTVLNIPFSGDFYVNTVDYPARTVTLLDPKNCLAKRLMKLDLSSSPFAAAYDYRNFTFYNCPGDSPMNNFRVIKCLSVDPNVTVVSFQLSSAETRKFYGCSKISTEEFPLLENDTFRELKLRWNVPSCADCEGFGPRGKGRNCCLYYFKSKFL